MGVGQQLLLAALPHSKQQHIKPLHEFSVTMNSPAPAPSASQLKMDWSVMQLTHDRFKTLPVSTW
jgi:hypothetical protein